MATQQQGMPEVQDCRGLLQLEGVIITVLVEIAFPNLGFSRLCQLLVAEGKVFGVAHAAVLYEKRGKGMK